MRTRDRLARLAWREYLPMLLTIALWGVILLVIGHADTARLFAATILVRSTQMLTRLATAPALRARVGAEAPVRRQARRFARLAQGGAWGGSMVVLALLILLLARSGQQEIALFLPLIAIGMPARILRFSDARTDSPYYRMALAGGGLAAAAAGWALGLDAIGMALAFGAREWIALAMIRYWPKAAHVPRRPLGDPLRWAEIGQSSVISARRLISYRLTKVALAVFGPLGNLAARTGRGLNWHNRIEPYLPRSLAGFILFAVTGMAAAAVLAARSGEPAAMIAAAGLLQLASTAANIALLWRYLPSRADVDLLDDDEDD